MSGAFRSYVASQVPGWLLALLVAWALNRWAGLPGWLVVLLYAAWVVKDLLLFPSMRRFYRSEPSARRIVGEKGTAVSTLAPDGFVRVQGELWQARGDGVITEGTPVRVRDIQGLILLVGPDAGGTP